MRAILVCFLIMLALQLATPFWWWTMLVPFLYGISTGRSASESIKVATMSAGGLWFLTGLYHWLISSRQVSDRVIAMMGVQSNGALLLLATTLLAVLAAGVSASCGYFMRATWRS